MKEFLKSIIKFPLYVFGLFAAWLHHRYMRGTYVFALMLVVGAVSFVSGSLLYPTVPDLHKDAVTTAEPISTEAPSSTMEVMGAKPVSQIEQRSHLVSRSKHLPVAHVTLYEVFIDVSLGIDYYEVYINLKPSDSGTYTYEEADAARHAFVAEVRGVCSSLYTSISIAEDAYSHYLGQFAMDRHPLTLECIQFLGTYAPKQAAYVVAQLDGYLFKPSGYFPIVPVEGYTSVAIWSDPFAWEVTPEYLTSESWVMLEERFSWSWELPLYAARQERLPVFNQEGDFLGWVNANSIRVDWAYGARLP